MLSLVFLNRSPLVPLDSYCDCSRDNDLCLGQLEGKFGLLHSSSTHNFPIETPFMWERSKQLSESARGRAC
jgi:hypothetical protein